MRTPTSIARLPAPRRAPFGLAAMILAGLVSLGAVPALAEHRAMQGHIALGYAKASTSSDLREVPGGSLSVAAGLDFPVASRLRAGLEVGYDLLGASNIERGSLFADVDYSTFEALALARWAPTTLGPLALVSAGPGLFNARADLSASAGGPQFRDLALEQTVVGFAFGATVMPHPKSPVRAGLEIGYRWIPLDNETWTLFTLRLAVHY
jgi:hypothetical protein